MPPATVAKRAAHELAKAAELVWYCALSVIGGWGLGATIDYLFRQWNPASPAGLAAALGVQLVVAGIVVVIARPLLRLVPAPTDLVCGTVLSDGAWIGADIVFAVCVFASQRELNLRTSRLFGPDPCAEAPTPCQDVDPGAVTCGRMPRASTDLGVACGTDRRPPPR